MLPPATAIAPPDEAPEAKSAPRAAWSTPTCRILNAAEAEFGPNFATEGSIGYS